ncbi:MAG TPA: hypothetical protein VFA06_04635 [Actinocrinis sp.]|uniref:hypothetical protein n=1 Tax=Actinocrinis sp. TaxID=1920516 RepID=UPI002D5F0309|nr:hypothetical protein [Actinocrinis sp.]HZU55131.1 hypothetical protein [Actinocrinis sp.]
MDPKTRKAVSARDAGLVRVSRATRLIGVASVAGAVIAAAGFAHLIPTHLPHLNVDNGGGSGSGSGGSGSSNGSGGLQGPNNAPGGGGSGPSQVQSGGS